MIREDGGSAMTTTIVMLPFLLMVFAGVLELGVLRAVLHRVASAADLATIVAVGDQDQSELERTGTLRLASNAEEVAREYFALNLSSSQAALASTPADIAAAADVVSFPIAPGIDPATGMRYDRPTVRIIASVPLKTPGLALILMPAVTTITIRSASSAR